MVIGVLALQGDAAEHAAVLKALGTDVRDVRNSNDLSQCERLIIPGGESTVIAKLLKTSGLDAVIIERANKNTLAIFGSCAGAILLAREITGKHPPQTFGLIDMTVERNAYGEQTRSFEATVHVRDIGGMQCAFIRAPRITQVGKDVEVLAEHDGSPVIVRQGRFLAATCHPEVRGESALHRFFCTL
jgi:5'-phosphate synthase pdxT subunit